MVLKGFPNVVMTIDGSVQSNGGLYTNNTNNLIMTLGNPVKTHENFFCPSCTFPPDFRY